MYLVLHGVPGLGDVVAGGVCGHVLVRLSPHLELELRAQVVLEDEDEHGRRHLGHDDQDQESRVLEPTQEEGFIGVIMIGHVMEGIPLNLDVLREILKACLSRLLHWVCFPFFFLRTIASG